MNISDKTMILRVIFSLISIINICTSIEILNEKAWMDYQYKDIFFEYSDLTQPTVEIKAESNKYSNNIDFKQFEEAETSSYAHSKV